jgi:hypothetical protein
MSTLNLSETRRRDRMIMAAALESLITQCGANWQRREGSSPYPGAQCIELQVSAARGLSVRVSLNGESCQPNVYVLSWHMQSGSQAQLNQATFGGSVNPYHRQKATYVAHGFADLCAQLKSGLLKAADSSAFLSLDESVAA